MADSNNDNPRYTRDFDKVLKAESDHIEERRKYIGLTEADREKFCEKIEKLHEKFKKPSENKWKFHNGKIGLAFSGGGIRSATFNLGVLQALARKNILRFCDYLSTVSGGGYIGSCFSSLLDKSDASVELKKFPFRFIRADKADERKEVKWLRRHSNYLVLNMSFLGLDLWRFIGLYFSGLVLTNITTVSLTIFLTYFLYEIVQSVSAPAELAATLLKVSGGVVILLIITRWGAALRNLEYTGRRWRGYLQGFFARTAAGLAILGGFIMLAVHLPAIERQTSGLVSNLLHGGTAGSGAGLLMGLLKSQNKTLEKIRKAIFKVAWVALLPILLAQFIRVLWAAETFGPEIFGVPLLIVLAIMLFVISLFTNTNRISMHHFYRDRLSEAYIIKRVKEENEQGNEESEEENEETIISNEPLTLQDLHIRPPEKKSEEQSEKRPNGAPYHLIHTTLNVPSSTNRYLRGRGADFFLFSKLYCGSESTGYRRTDEYDKGRTRLATAMAISGAAVSPQMGELSSPIMTFILTLLNVRLNRWMPNPNRDRKGWIEFWPYYFVKELLDKGREDDRLLNLSDGGHHENLGIYELIRRRCEVIIASDATGDPDFNFGALANVMRKTRIDMGVEIKIDLEQLRQDEDSEETALHYAVGTIEYPDAPKGILVYIKSSITGDESEDLLAYRRKYPTFPDQSTADQFFDEAQFESYRELGYLIGKEVFSENNSQKPLSTN